MDVQEGGLVRGIRLASVRRRTARDGAAYLVVNVDGRVVLDATAVSPVTTLLER